MGDLVFVVKTLVITVALVVLMQIKVGSRTVEQHSLAWIHQSVFVEQLQEVAAGAVKAGRKGVAMMSGMLGIKTAQFESRVRNIDSEIEKIGSSALSTNAEIK
ncbi:MAG: hypothetical protein V4760_00675 [Bdellovibrionota bacterium]